MVDIYKYPSKESWNSLMERAFDDNLDLKEGVLKIMKSVKEKGDEALLEYAEKFDGVKLTNILVTDEEIEKGASSVSEELKSAILMAAQNIEKFHKAQTMVALDIEVMPGVRCEQRAVPIQKVGLYIPGGNSPLFSTLLMLAIPAKIAGCREIVLCTPPNKKGEIHSAILYAAKIAGVNKIFKIGGAQAVAAMTYGTESVPKVYKIFGPGNKYVMEAKLQASMQNVAIDMPAGPSEVMVIADADANPYFVASDFLSQAEHGPDSQSILLTTDEAFANKMPEVIEELLATLPRQEMMKKSLSHSRIIILKDEDEVWEFANEYAPEHLIINCKDARSKIDRVENAGSVFIGAYSPESVGDYASGTNHTLPTSGYSKSYSGVNLDSFTKKITFQELTADGIKGIGSCVEIMAHNEDLMAHKLAVTLRKNEITDKL